MSDFVVPTEKHIISVKTYKLMDDLRNAMLRDLMRPWLFVRKSKEKEDEWDIYLSSEFSSYPSEEAVKDAQKYAKEYVKKNTEAPKKKRIRSPKKKVAKKKTSPKEKVVEEVAAPKKKRRGRPLKKKIEK
jgi:hypothetical protein